jgi:hypothetical protein
MRPDDGVAKRRGPWMRHLKLLMLAVTVSLLAACNQLPPDCRIGDTETQQFSTRALFLERLSGCPVGGRS